MTPRVALAALLLAAALPCAAQRTTRPGRLTPLQPVRERLDAPAADTLALTDGATLTVTGYDKTLTSRRESFFVTNTACPGTLVWFAATIDYLDMDGRQLHRRRAAVRCHVPPGQTRRLDIPSWDRQCVYYYHASTPRRRLQSASASPYTVAIRVDSIATIHVDSIAAIRVDSVAVTLPSADK